MQINSIEYLFQKLYDRLAIIDFKSGIGESLALYDETFAILNDFGYDITEAQKQELIKTMEPD